MRTLAVVSVVAVVLTGIPARTAEACSQPACYAAQFVPATGGQIPENAPGIYWRPLRDNVTAGEPEPANVTLIDVAAPNQPIALTAHRLDNGDVLLEPSSPLIAGHHYTISDRTDCTLGDGVGIGSSFTVTPAAALPTALELGGDQPQRAPVAVATRSGECTTEVDSAQAMIRVARSGNAAWHDVLHFETLVDGKAWRYSRSLIDSERPGASVEGRGVDRVFAVCYRSDLAETQAETTYPAPGKHTVAMRAVLPGTTLSVTSNEIELDLSCDPSTKVDEQPDTREEAHAGGCTAGGHNGAAAWALGALAGLLARRRRDR